VNHAVAAESLKLGAALTHPLITVLAQPAQTIASTYETSAITDYAQAMSLRQKVVKLQPKNANDQILLARDAYATQSYAIVATSLQAYLALSPNLTKAQRKQLQGQIAQFQLLAKSSSSGSGISPTP
jgi:cytochrome c-type biogenesis protein CcmH/NrfG